MATYSQKTIILTTVETKINRVGKSLRNRHEEKKTSWNNALLLIVVIAMKKIKKEDKENKDVCGWNKQW